MNWKINCIGNACILVGYIYLWCRKTDGLRVRLDYIGKSIEQSLIMKSTYFEWPLVNLPLINKDNMFLDKSIDDYMLITQGGFSVAILRKPLVVLSSE